MSHLILTSRAFRSIPSLPLKLAMVLLASSLNFLAHADETPSAGVIHIDHAKVAAGGTLLQTNNFKIMVLHRNAPGEVEIHEHDTDIFHVLEGSATFITGGKAVGIKTGAAGEARAKEIDGGEEHHLAKGDVIVIPRGVPHWFKEIDGTFRYYVVKVSK